MTPHTRHVIVYQSTADTSVDTGSHDTKTVDDPGFAEDFIDLTDSQLCELDANMQ